MVANPKKGSLQVDTVTKSSAVQTRVVIVTVGILSILLYVWENR